MIQTSTLAVSHEVGHLKRSVMRDMLALATSPDIISLAGGLPNSALLPAKAFAESLARAIQDHGAKALQYSPPFLPLREWIRNYMEAKGVSCTVEQVFITNGAQQGLAILSRLFLDPGQKAMIEETTFTGIQQITAGRGAETHTATTDLLTGVRTAEVEAIFRDQQPRLAVVIPSFHNPLGVTITLEKRQELAALSARYQVPLIEDDPYSSLRFEGDPVPPIKAFDEAGTVFYLGSFSKMLAPAVRLGWVVAPAELIPRITVIRESLDLETSTLTQRGVYDFLSRGYLEPHLEELNAANRVRRDAMMTALERELGEIASWTRPQGGLFVWVTLPETVDTWEMFEEAVQTHQVAYIPGSAFNVYDRGRNTMRLNFSNASPELIQQGIHRLATVIRSRLD